MPTGLRFCQEALAQAPSLALSCTPFMVGFCLCVQAYYASLASPVMQPRCNHRLICARLICLSLIFKFLFSWRYSNKMKINFRNFVLAFEISRQNQQNKITHFQSVSKTALPQNRAKTAPFATECNQNATYLPAPVQSGKSCIVAHCGKGKGKFSAHLAHITGNLAHALPVLSLRPWTPTKGKAKDRIGQA